MSQTKTQRTSSQSQLSILPNHILKQIALFIGTTKSNNSSETTAALMYTKSVSPNILIVGSGNFTFPNSLAYLRSQTKGIYGTFNQTTSSSSSSSQLYATSYDSLTDLHAKYGESNISNTLSSLSNYNAITKHNIDATALNLSDFNGVKFDLIIFNFPKVASTSLEEFRIAGRVARNRYLIAAFLHSAASLLSSKGMISIAQKEGNPYKCWTCKQATEWVSNVQHYQSRTLLNSSSNKSSSSSSSSNSNTAVIRNVHYLHASTPFTHEIFRDYDTANVSPEGSKKRCDKGFGTTSKDGKPTAYVHFFALNNQPAFVSTEKDHKSFVGMNNGKRMEVRGCRLCQLQYKYKGDEKAHENGKKHKFNELNRKQWLSYLEHLYPLKDE